MYGRIRHMRVMRALLAATVLAVLAACAGGSSTTAASTSSTSQSSSSSSTATTTTTPATPEEAVKAAYLAYWKMVDRLFAAPDPTSADLARLAADPLLTVVRDNLATKQAQGHTYTRPDDRPSSHRLDAVSVAGSSAEVTDCYVDGSVERDASGAVVDDAISTRHARATLALASGAWRLTDLEFPSSTPGVSGCAA
jgi:hypothetical protein